MTGWYRKRTDAKTIPGHMLAAGKVLLDMLRRRRANGGPKVDSIQRTLSDGSIVRAAFYGEQPLVDYIPAGGDPLSPTGCELVMQSGLLDLGANLSASAHDAPTFADTAGTVHFGDTCKVEGRPAGGKLQVFANASGTIRVIGELLADDVTDEPAIAADAAESPGLSVTRQQKKDAQGLMPASLWTGLMHRHVQSLYGNPKAVYSVDSPSAPKLKVATTEEGGEYLYDFRATRTTGLIDPGHTHRYWFVEAEDDGLTLRPAVPRNECAKLLQKALQTGAIKEAYRDRIEHYLLASLVPNTDEDAAIDVAFDTPVDGAPFAYGWKFNERGSEIAVVTFDKVARKTKLWRRELAFDEDGNLDVTENDGAWTDYLAGRDSAQQIPGGIAIPRTNQRTLVRAGIGSGSLQYPLTIGGGWDAPVYCYFIKDGADTGRTTLEVIYSKFALGAGHSAESETGCYNALGDAPWELPYPCATEDDPGARCAGKIGFDAFYVSAGFYSSRYSTVAVSLIADAPGGGYVYAYTDVDAAWHDGLTLGDDIDAGTPFSYSQIASGAVTKYINLSGEIVDDPADFTLDQIADASDCGPTGCECSAQEGALVGDPYTTVDVDPCPATNGAALLVTGTYFFDTVGSRKRGYITEFNAYTKSKIETEGRPSNLVIPTASATGVMLRQHSLIAQTGSASQALYANPGASGINLTDYWGLTLAANPDGQCEYDDTSTLPRAYTYGADLTEQRTTSSCIGDLPDVDVDETSGGFYSATQTLKTAWLLADQVDDRGAELGDLSPDDHSLAGSLYSESGDPSLVGSLDAPCQSITVTDLAVGVHDPILTNYFLEAVADDFEAADLGFMSKAEVFEDQRIDLRSSARFAYAQHEDPERLPELEPDPALLYSADYPPVTFPSFIGWA